MKKWLWITLGIISLLLVVFVIVRNQDSDWNLENELF